MMGEALFLDEDNNVQYDVDERYQHDDDEDSEKTPQIIFPDMQERILAIMEELDTKTLFPKLNWSSPKDACYMTSYNTVKIDSIEELFRMLKASDFVAFDLKKCEELGERPVLCLKKHYDIRTSTEFRCFVKGGELVAISQRDMTNFYSFLSEEKDKFITEMRSFFNDHIKGQFPLEDYVVDLYKSRTNRWWIMDFNVWGLPTHPALFESWDTLTEISEKIRVSHVDEGDESIAFRTLVQQPMMQPSFQQYSGMPIDLVRVENINEFLTELQRQETEKKNEGVAEEQKDE